MDSRSHVLAKLQSALVANSSIRFSVKYPFCCPHRLSINLKAERDFAISSVLGENQAMTTTEEDVQHCGIFDLDPSLENFKDHLIYRSKKYVEQKSLIEKFEGSLEEFSQGYLKFGFNREQDAIVYREWAPAAQLLRELCSTWKGMRRWRRLVKERMESFTRLETEKQMR